MKVITYLILILGLYGGYTFFFKKKSESNIEPDSNTIHNPKKQKPNPVEKRLQLRNNNQPFAPNNEIKPSNVAPSNINAPMQNIQQSNGQEPVEPDNYANESMPEEQPIPSDPIDPPEVTEPINENDDYDKSINQQPQINTEQYQTPTYNPDTGEYTGINDN